MVPRVDLLSASVVFQVMLTYFFLYIALFWDENLYYKLRKTFSKFYRRYYNLISKFQVGLKTLLRQGLSEPEFHGDLVLCIN